MFSNTEKVIIENDFNDQLIEAEDISHSMSVESIKICEA